MQFDRFAAQMYPKQLGEKYIPLNKQLLRELVGRLVKKVNKAILATRLYVIQSNAVLIPLKFWGKDRRVYFLFIRRCSSQGRNNNRRS